MFTRLQLAHSPPPLPLWLSPLGWHLAPRALGVRWRFYKASAFAKFFSEAEITDRALQAGINNSGWTADEIEKA